MDLWKKRNPKQLSQKRSITSKLLNPMLFLFPNPLNFLKRLISNTLLQKMEKFNVGEKKKSSTNLSKAEFTLCVYKCVYTIVCKQFISCFLEFIHIKKYDETKLGI